MPLATQHILVVDDEPNVHVALARQLKVDPYEVFTAESSDEALQLLGKHTFAVIVADYLMPKMNGFEVLEKLKADEKTKDIPVILLTNLNQKDEIEKGLVLGADDYMIKAHFMPSEVVAKIRKVLGR